MELFLETLRKIDVGTVIILLSGIYIANKNTTSKLEKKIDSLEIKLEKKINDLELKLDKKIDDLEIKLEKKIDNLENKIEKTQESLTDIDRRLCRLEGAFSSKDCCMIKDSSQIKKAE